MSGAAAWRWCLAAGLIAFACSWAFGRIPGLTACGDTGGLGPIIAFEFARTPGEVAALFGAEPCRSTLVAAQRTALWLDALGFIPAYTTFLSLAALASAGRRGWFIVASMFAAALADEIEGVLLWRTLAALPGEQVTLDALFWAVRVKFAMLAAASFAIGSCLFVDALRRRRSIAFFGLLVAIGGGSAFHRLLQVQPERMMIQFTIAWTALLLLAATGAVWPRLLALRPRAPAPPSA